MSKYTKAKILSEKEFIVRLKVLTGEFTVFCRECGRNIKPSEDYIGDFFWMQADAASKSYWQTHIVCFNCWKGEQLL